MFSSYYNSPMFSDLVIKINGGELKVHKIILSSQSGYFFDKLKVSSKPNGSGSAESYSVILGCPNRRAGSLVP